MSNLFLSLYLFVCAGFVVFALEKAARPEIPKEKILLCDDSKAQKVRVPLRRVTTLSFPVPPADIVPGENSFDFHRVKNDLNIKALRPGATTNIVVYLPERRCTFDLVTVQSGGDGILIIKDPQDKLFEVKFE